MNAIVAPRGTRDVYPPESRAWETLEGHCRSIAERFGYGEIRTPMFEATELFVRGVGETTDIVEKEMYTFEDKGGRSMTLRPEWTAPVVRAALEHNLLAPGSLRVFYVGPFFRYERPQKGRYRQANQFGVECFGFAGAEADVEVMQLALALLRRYGIDDARLSINSIGDAHCRPAYQTALYEYFVAHRNALSLDSQNRLTRNPLRILDSKAPEDAPYIETAPTFLETLCDACAAHFAAVRGYLDAIGAPYDVVPRLVRGFDYYTRTVFEIMSASLGAQSALCGGGRYDNLVASLGGPATPAVGFGLGLDRFLMARDAGGTQAPPERRGLQVVALGEAARRAAIPLVAALRARIDLPTHIDYADRKIGAQFKIADRNNARFAVIIGDDELARNELVVRDLVDRVERRVALGDTATESAQTLCGGGG